MYVSMNSRAAQGIQVNQTQKSAETSKPTWNNNKIYDYCDDFGNDAIAYGKKCQQYYAGITAKDGVMSTDEVKKQIGEMFSEYTFTNTKPKDSVAGKHLLYIDDSNLKKMAEDPDFRAKVYGLLDREYNCGKTLRLRYSDGKVVDDHITGSFFTLCNDNKKYAGADGVPYLGGCMTDHPWSSSDSHPQFRDKNYVYDHIDPAKSAAKDRAAAKKNSKNKPAAAKAIADRQAKKLKEKQAEKAKEKKKADKERLEKLAEKRAEAKEALDELLESDAFTDEANAPEPGQFFDYQA